MALQVCITFALELPVSYLKMRDVMCLGQCLDNDDLPGGYLPLGNLLKQIILDILNRLMRSFIHTYIHIYILWEIDGRN